MRVQLVKEPDNEFDQKAIQVMVKGLGKCDYMANSPYTAKGKILYVLDQGILCKITDTGMGNDK